MKLLILHLSDIHFGNKDSYSKTHMSNIAKTVKKNKGINTVLIIISGDIAYSGKIEEYNTSYHFLSSLRNKLRESSDIKKVEFALVPGNHDVDYDFGEMSSKELDEMFKSEKQEEKLFKEFDKMKAFYNHANGLGCFPQKRELIYIKSFQVEGIKIRLNLVNTAVFSSLGEDQGLHYMPMYEIDKINDIKDDDFIFTIMHHPHHWFHSNCKKNFEKSLYKASDIIFVGHEHYSSSMKVELDNFDVKICAGGKLADRGDWHKSEYFIGILDLESRIYETVPYHWDDTANIYVSGEKKEWPLSKTRVNKFDLYPNKDYNKKMFADNKYMITEDFSDYYVFPRIEEEIINEKRIPLEIKEVEECIHMIFEKKKVIFIGRNDSGKTVLLKQLFKNFIETKVVIYLDSYHFGDDYEKIIRMAFTDIYSDNIIKYESFTQLEKNDKVLLIDNVDDLNIEEFDLFLQKAEQEFDIVIFTCNKLVDVDMKERIKRRVIEEDYIRFNILPFFKDKREDLVCKLVNILVKQDDAVRENITNMLCSALSKQKKLFHMDPDFIVQFTKYYCNNIGETIQNDGEIFSKVFESNIISLIKPFAKNISVDKIFIILDKISYVMHTTKEYPMSQRSIIDIINSYNDEFDSEVDYMDFLDILLSSKIFTKVNVKYKFYDKTYLSYFVAREIKRRCMEEEDFSEFEKALEFSCFGINADIILFVTYITDNLMLIRKIMQKAEEYLFDWEEFSIAPIKIPYLADIGQLEVKKVNENDIVEDEKKEIENEKQFVEKRSYNSERIYDYAETELNLMDRMLRSISLLNVLSRTLPSFEHMMKRQDKEFCVKMIYTMPLKIFNVWAKEIEDNKLELIDEIKSIGEWEYKKDKKYIENKDALNFLRWESISLLMELMNASIGNATKENTYRFLDSFDYKSSEIYQIEHLMGLDNRDAIGDFLKEVEILYESMKEQIPRLMLRRVARHFMLSSKKIQRKQIQRLNAKLWDGKMNNTALLIEKDRSKKKEQ